MSTEPESIAAIVSGMVIGELLALRDEAEMLHH